MECLSVPKQGNEIQVFTLDANMTAVGKKIISLLKRDFTYLVGSGGFQDTVLEWIATQAMKEDCKKVGEKKTIDALVYSS